MRYTSKNLIVSEHALERFRYRVGNGTEECIKNMMLSELNKSTYHGRRKGNEMRLSNGLIYICKNLQGRTSRFSIVVTVLYDGAEKMAI